jgi:hypothetical protein
MSARRPHRTVFSITAVALVTAVGGCGGGSSDKPDAKAKTAEAGKVLAQTFGPNSKARSGQFTATINVAVKGVKRYREPVVLETSGPYSYSSGNDLVDVDQTLSLTVHNLENGAGMTISGDEAFVNLGSTAYPIPSGIVATMRKNARGVRNPIIRATAPFGIRIDRWVRKATVVGHQTVTGVDTIHVTGDVKPERIFVDASRFTHLLKSLQVTRIVDLPDAIGPGARAALARSVKTAHGDIYTGAADHALRKAQMTMTLEPSKADRRRLGGIRSATIKATLDVTEVGQSQDIKLQPDRGKYSELLQLFDAASFSNRSPDQRGK